MKTRISTSRLIISIFCFLVILVGGYIIDTAIVFAQSEQSTQKFDKDLRDVTINIVAAFVWAVLGATITLILSNYRRYFSDRELQNLLGASTVADNKIVIVYPTFTSSQSKGLNNRFRSIVANLEDPYLEGPDELVALNDLMGIKHVLELNHARLSKVEFVPHSTFPKPSLWPKKSIIAIGGPAVNEVSYHCLMSMQGENSYIRFDTSSYPWKANVVGHPEPLSSPDRRKLDYGFIYRIRNPTSQENSVVLLFGMGSQGTEAACFFIKTQTKVAANFLKKHKLIVLKVTNAASTSPEIIFPQAASSSWIVSRWWRRASRNRLA